MGKLVHTGQAAEGWTLGPGGWIAQQGWGQRSDTVWAWRLNQEAEPAAAVNPEHRQEVLSFFTLKLLFLDMTPGPWRAVHSPDPRLTEKRPLILLLLPMKNLEPLVLRALGNDRTCLLGNRKPVNVTIWPLGFKLTLLWTEPDELVRHQFKLV